MLSFSHCDWFAMSSEFVENKSLDHKSSVKIPLFANFFPFTVAVS